jgi:hypothetical protein
MPKINLTPSHGEPLDNRAKGAEAFPSPETYSLPKDAKVASLPHEAAKMRETLEHHAIPGPVKEIMQKRSPLEQNLLALGVVIGTPEAIKQVPTAFANALKNYLQQ